MSDITKINPRLLQGFRDFLPQKKMQRDWLIEKVRKVYESFGFQPLETPVLEYADILTGKYGEEANTMMYQFEDHGQRKVAMRYDLTVPFSRVIAQYPDLTKPFKRYQVAPVWRADSPQAGRYREFYQFDADVAGSSSMLADAEIVCLICTVMRELGIANFMARINNRKVLNGLLEYADVDPENTTRVFQAVDKIEKIGPDEVKKELLSEKTTIKIIGKDEYGNITEEVPLPSINQKSVEKILKFLAVKGSNEEVLKKLNTLFTNIPIGQEGVRELEEVLSYLDAMGIDKSKVKIDLSIARGLDYYTGTVFETTLLDLPGFGSVFSGGRFDELIGVFTGQNVPAVGASVGVDRLFSAMEQLELLPETSNTSQVLVTIFQENTADSLKAARKLRDNGFSVEVYLGEKPGLKPQLRYANKRAIPITVITYPDQTEKDIYIVKKMADGSQIESDLAGLTETVEKSL